MSLPLLAVAVHALVLGAAAPSPQAKAAFDRGEKALAANQLDAAAAAYREAMVATPQYAAAINGLGSVLFKQGKREDAVAQFKAAIQADPSFKLAHFNLGYAARKLGDFATAATAYEQYTRLDPNDPDGFYGLGESYRQLGQAQQAVGAYEQYVAKERRPTEQKYVERAREYIRTLKAEAAAPGSAPAPAPVPAPAGTPAAAAPAPAPAPAPAGPPGGLPPGGTAQTQLSARRIGEGDRLMQEKKYRDASFAYQDAVNADPNNIEGLFKLGNAYAVLGYYAQAIERWTRASQLATDPAVKKSALDNIARAQAKMAQAGGGSPQAQGRAPGTGPVADSTRAQARVAYEQGVKQIGARDYAGALASLTTAIQYEPTLTVAYVARGSAHIGLRRFNEAIQDYQYALRLDSGLASPLYGLAEAYRALGRTADARQYYSKYSASTAPDVRTELQSEARQKADSLR